MIANKEKYTHNYKHVSQLPPVFTQKYKDGQFFKNNYLKNKEIIAEKIISLWKHFDKFITII